MDIRLGKQIFFRSGVYFLFLLVFSGCDTWLGQPAREKLAGERISILLNEEVLEPDPSVQGQKIQLPTAQINKDWPQPGGAPHHAMPPLHLPEDLQEAWRASIGLGADEEGRFLSGPVFYEGMVYAMDTHGHVTAIEGKTGEKKWQVSTNSEIEPDRPLGGGVACEGANVFVATAFSEVLCLKAENGEIVWRQSINNPSRIAPTVKDGRLFVLTINNELEVLDAKNGTRLWSHAGISEIAGLLGGANPAVYGDVVIAPYSSGEVYALKVENGHVLWSEGLTAPRRADSASAISHIRARPVIDQGKVFLVSHNGRMVAFDLRTGGRVWDKAISGIRSPWISGNYIYLLTLSNQLICLSRETGKVYWVKRLPRGEEEGNTYVEWAGPILAGGNLILAGSNGTLLFLSPQNGEKIKEINIGRKIVVSPIVAQETLFLLTEDAEIIAYR